MSRLRIAIAAALAAAAPAQDEFDASHAIERGCEILLELQEGDDDRWPYEGVYRVGGQIPIGYHVGGTAICARALLEAPGYAEHDARRAAVRRALGFVLRMLDEPRMAARFDGRYDVRGWGHTYALLLLLRLAELGRVPEGQEDAVAAKTDWLIGALVATEIPESGGWSYSRPRGAGVPGTPASPFMTAPTLQALFWAQARGHEVDDGVLDRGLDALERGRTASGGYAYSIGTESLADAGEEDLHFMHRQIGAIGRMVAVEATLELAGRGDAERLAHAVAAFFRHWPHLKDRKQEQGTHLGPGGVAPYYFMFAHRYAAQAIELLPEAERDAHRQRLWRVLAREAEPEGGWNDRVFARSRSYGTAFGMLALLEPELPRVRRVGGERAK